MATGKLTRARETSGGSIPPVLATSMALLVTLVLLAPVDPVVRGAPSQPAAALVVVRPGHVVDRRNIEAPGWWTGGPCDPNNYPGSHPLAASWHGLVACGPGPTQGGSDHRVSFFPGAWGEFEWECVELSMRWMYLAWGVNPYPANGWDVVRDYNLANYKAKFNPNGPQLVVVNNGTLGAVPQPGDVISVARTQTDAFGHTAVVTANAVDASGNGTITIIQQNGGTGNDGWATYPVSNWVVGDGVSDWLHNPAWSFQRPVVGFSGTSGFEARVAAPGNHYQLLTTGTGSIAVAGDTGPTGANGDAIYGYVDQNGNFMVRRGSSANWVLAAKNVASIAIGLTTTRIPVLAYLDTTGNFYAKEGSLSGAFTLEARAAASIAIAAGGGAAPPLLGFVQSSSGALLEKTGVAGSNWTLAQPTGVRSIAVAEGTSVLTGLLGYVSTNGSFFAKQASPLTQWTKEASSVTAISLASIGPSGVPLLSYLAGNGLYAAQSLTPSSWVHEASGVAQIAAAAGSAPGALPVLGYLSTAGDLELMQGPLSGTFSVQAHGVTSLALSSRTDS